MSRKSNFIQVQWLTPVIPAPLEADIERIAVQAQPKPKKLERPYLKTKLGVLVHICNHSYLGNECRTIIVQGWTKAKGLQA
jgi:hypothetical protein